LANKVMMAQTGGISMEDIQRMEHMSDAERAQYLQQSGKLASTSAKAQQNQPALQKQQQKTALVNKMQEYARQLSAGHNEYRAIRERAVEAGRKLYNNSYKARYESLEAQKQQAIQEGALDEMSPNEAAYQRLKAADSQQTDLMCDFYRQYIPSYRKAIVDQMAYCKNTLLPAAKGHQQTVDELYRLTGEAQYAISATEVTATAALYLETPGALQDYEIDF
jgi:bisphosphoglycerate-dependent phosphoglycerate mutase